MDQCFVSPHLPPSFCNSPDREKRKAAFQISWYQYRWRSEVDTRCRTSSADRAPGWFAVFGRSSSDIQPDSDEVPGSKGKAGPDISSVEVVVETARKRHRAKSD